MGSVISHCYKGRGLPPYHSGEYVVMLLICLKGYYLNSMSLSSYPMGKDNYFNLKFQRDRKTYWCFMKKGMKGTCCYGLLWIFCAASCFDHASVCRFLNSEGVVPACFPKAV